MCDAALAAAGGFLVKGGVKTLSQAGKVLFSNKLKAKLVAKGVAQVAAGTACAKALTFIGSLFNPGDAVANWLDRSDRLGTTGYLDF